MLLTTTSMMMIFTMTMVIVVLIFMAYIIVGSHITSDMSFGAGENSGVGTTFVVCLRVERNWE